MRVGAIDIGTNSIHLLVADIAPDGTATLVEKAREQVALGQGGLGRLSDEAFDRGLAALERFKVACDGLGVDDVHAAATSAVREADNGVAFCKAVKAATGIHVRIIAGRDEARLIWLGARPHLDTSRGRVLLVDLGGGSTEFILCDTEEMLASQSLPVGHIRATEAMARPTDGGPVLPKRDRQQLRERVRERLRPVALRIRPEDVGSLVGTSGTMRCLARMDTLARGERLPDFGDGMILTRRFLGKLLSRMAKIDARALTELPGMDAKRRATLPAGAVIVAEILDLFDVDQLVTSTYALRDGLIADWVLRNRPEIDLSATVSDPRRRTVLRVMERFNVHAQHGRHVARMALALFDATTPRHRLRLEDRRLLEWGALLHDIGHHIAGEDHHKHGEYILLHTRMSGFTAPEIARLACLVRYHRGKRPKPTHPTYASLPVDDQERVRVLSALLGLADAFDRGHDGNTAHLDAELDGDTLRVMAHTLDDGLLEGWAVDNRKRAVEDALGVRVDVRIRPRTPDEPESGVQA